MYTIETLKIDATRRVRIVADDDYQTRGSYGYGTDEETRAAEDEEIENLNNGTWEALGVIVESQCACCGQWAMDDAVWGCVVAVPWNAADLVRDHMGLEVTASW